MTEQRRDYGDGTIHQRKDDGRWVVSVRYTDAAGRSRRRWATAKDEKAARSALRELRKDSSDLPASTRTTIKAWCETWATTTLASSARRSATRSTYAALVASCIVPGLGDVALDKLTPQSVTRWALTLRGSKSASTVRQAHAVLCLALDDAVAHQLVPRNVARAAPRPRLEPQEGDVFTAAEVSRLLDVASADRLSPLLVLIAYTGMRRGEALGLRWTDVDLDAAVASVSGTLTRQENRLIRQPAPKTRAGARAVPLVPPVVAALSAWRRRQMAERLAAGPAWTATGYVFTTEMGTPVDPRNALRWFYSVRARARSAWEKEAAGTGEDPGDALRSGSLHTLRHSAATTLLSSGLPMVIVSAILGHSSVSTTVDLYGHVQPAAHADVVAAALMMTLVESPQGCSAKVPTWRGVSL